MVETYKPQGLFRFILAMLVLWSHSVVFFFPEIGWFGTLQLGNVAVACFFVLSGYLMFEAGRDWYDGRPGAFLLNRYLRILPPFLVAAIVSILIHFGFSTFSAGAVGIDDIPEHALSRNNVWHALLSPLFPFNWIFIRLLALTEASYQFVRYSWAIFTELIFYWGLFFYLAMCRALPRWLVNVAALSGALALAILGFIFYNGEMLGAPDWMIRATARIPSIMHLQWAPHFIFGAAVSVIARRKSAAAVALGLAAFAGALLQLAAYAARGGVTSSFLVLVQYAFLVGVVIAISRLTPAQIVKSSLLSPKLDRRFGDLSYPIYINQFSLSVAFVSTFAALSWTIQDMALPLRIAVFIFYNGVIVAFSALLIQLTDYFTRPWREMVRGRAI